MIRRFKNKLHVSLGLFDGRRRLLISVVSAACFATALVGYIATVNVLLLAGDQIRSGNAEIRRLERETNAMREEFAQLNAPAAVEARSRAIGMVDIAGMHYLPSSSAVAISR